MTSQLSKLPEIDGKGHRKCAQETNGRKEAEKK